mmetsp:Transcript_6453/g.21578  ORF Transcript_6453/g.21578 Transcript_6453/m.21578 type:complete len:249 (-) Transcript_6453:105-851(-)
MSVLLGETEKRTDHVCRRGCRWNLANAPRLCNGGEFVAGQELEVALEACTVGTKCPRTPHSTPAAAHSLEEETELWQHPALSAVRSSRGTVDIRAQKPSARLFDKHADHVAISRPRGDDQRRHSVNIARVELRLRGSRREPLHRLALVVCSRVVKRRAIVRIRKKQLSAERLERLEHRNIPSLSCKGSGRAAGTLDRSLWRPLRLGRRHVHRGGRGERTRRQNLQRFRVLASEPPFTPLRLASRHCRS